MADISQARALIDAIPAQAVIADKGYDSDTLIEAIEHSGAQAVIPPRRNRLTPRYVDWHRYSARAIWSSASSIGSNSSVV